MSSTPRETSAKAKDSELYREFLAEREEILKHKWLESEKLGHGGWVVVGCGFGGIADQHALGEHAGHVFYSLSRGVTDE